MADGVARNNWYRWAGIFSHHVSCQPIGGSELASRPQNTTHGCSFVTDCLEGWCTYSSSCNPHLGACYSMVEYDSVNSQPLWCCDFAHEVAVKATVAKVLVWDEARLGDDRLGGATIAMPTRTHTPRAWRQKHLRRRRRPRRPRRRRCPRQCKRRA